MKLDNVMGSKSSKSLLEKLQKFLSLLTTFAVENQVRTKTWREQRPEMIPDDHWYIPDYSKPLRDVERISYHRFVSDRLANLRKDVKEMIDQVQAGVKGNVEAIVNNFVLNKLNELQNQLTYDIKTKNFSKINRVYSRIVRQCLKQSGLWSQK